ncbi:unnamed protein product [Euphydryas editha]|uniref:Uncharacterized protein n=1 Tax=Euphydryas editha TaxID=104508 RepID=A0AAU9UL73_EUPED|nr:unnamed protein product [Euphydryas editha]
MGQNGGADFGALLQGAGKQLINQGGQALLNYGAQAIGNIINEVFLKKEVEHKRVLPSIKNYKVEINNNHEMRHAIISDSSMTSS